MRTRPSRRTPPVSRGVLFSIGASVLVSWICLETHLLQNSWGLLTKNGYTIPKESSVFAFRATTMNPGNGDWWLYGEDSNYYYSQAATQKNKTYVAIAKSKTADCMDFDPKNVQTWCP